MSQIDRESALADAMPARRRSRATVVCEALEGRQLLSTATAAAPASRVFVPPPPPALLGSLDGPVAGGFAGPRGVLPRRFGAGHGMTSGTTNPSSTTSPAVTTLKMAIDKEMTDRDAVLAKSQVTVGQMAVLNQDVRAATKAATTAVPSAALQTLQTDSHPTDGSQPDLTKVEADYKAILTAAGIPQAQVEKVVADVDAIRTASGVTANDVTTLAADAKAVQTAAQAARPTNTGMPVGGFGMHSFGRGFGGGFGGGDFGAHGFSGRRFGGRY
jgi:hypothetical protein